jgi:ketosteroid isomerase-like protein
VTVSIHSFKEVRHENTDDADDMKVRVYGDEAVVTGRNTTKGQFKGRDISGQYRWTDTWAKRNGRWQCVAEHDSKIAAGVDPSTPANKGPTQ